MLCLLLSVRKWWGDAVRRQPLVLPAVLAVLGVLCVEWGGWWWCLILLGLVLGLLGGVRCLVLCVIFVGVACGLHVWRLGDQAGMRELLGERVAWDMVVDSDTRVGREGREIFAKVRGGEAEGGRVLVRLPWMDEDVFVGDVLRVEGSVREPREPMNPGVMDEGDWLWREGAAVVLDADRVLLTGDVDSDWWLDRWVIDARAVLGERLVLGLPEDGDEGRVIRAMFLGEKPRGARELMDDFRLSGTIHVFAVSGLHVMMLGGFLVFVLRILGAPTSLWVIGGVAGMFVYALVTGMNPPAMRAAVMGAVFMGGWLFVRKPVLGNSVAVGALVAVFWDGHVVFSPGFQLSFGVLVAIVLVAGYWMRGLRWLTYSDPFLPRSLWTRGQEMWADGRRWLAGSLTVGGSAWMGSTPLMIWHFGIVTPVSILASLPLVLLVWCVLAVGCVSLVVGSFWDGGGVLLNRWNGVQAGGARWFAGKFASMEGGHFVLKEWGRGERVVVFAMPRGGGCSYLGIGGGVLLDGGDRDGFYREVWPSMRKKGARVDSVVATHGDSRHVGGLEVFVGMDLGLKQGLVTGESKRSYGRLLETMKEHEVDAVRVRRGDRFPLGEGSELEVVYVGDLSEGSADRRCMVLRLHWRGSRILFTGDAGYIFERWVIENEVDVGADVLVMGKERRDVSGMADFLDAVGAEVLVVSDTLFPEGETRDEKWYRMVEKMGIFVYRQERCGAVVMEMKGGVLQVRGWRD